MMLLFILCFQVLNAYVPQSLAPVVSVINSKIYECLKSDDRSEQNRVFNMIYSDLLRPIKLTNSSAVFALKKTDCIIKRFKEKKASSRNETKIAMELEHPNIIVNYVAFHQDYKGEKIGWIVSEFLDVPISKKNFKNENEIRKMCRDVCNGLAYMHSRDIAHLDMKLGNVMGKKNMSSPSSLNFAANLIKEVRADISTDMYKTNITNGINEMLSFLKIDNQIQFESDANEDHSTLAPNKYKGSNKLHEDSEYELFYEASERETASMPHGYVSESAEWYFTERSEQVEDDLETYVQKSCKIDNKLYNSSYYMNKIHLVELQQNRNPLMFGKKTQSNHGSSRIKQDEVIYKIIDFGFSRYIKGDGTLRMNNRYYGTYPYSPPEIYFDSIYSKKADIWCLGAMVYFLTTPKKLFYHKDGERDYAAYEDFLRERTNYYFGNYSHDLKDFVKKCMRRNYKERPSAEDLLKHPFLKKIF